MLALIVFLLHVKFVLLLPLAINAFNFLLTGFIEAVNGVLWSGGRLRHIVLHVLESQLTL